MYRLRRPGAHRYAFRTRNKLYMVMDYLNGGQLFVHLVRPRLPPPARRGSLVTPCVDQWSHPAIRAVSSLTLLRRLRYHAVRDTMPAIGWQNKEQMFSEEAVRFMLAELVLALSVPHPAAPL